MRSLWFLVLGSILLISLGLPSASSSAVIFVSPAATVSPYLAVGDWWTLTESTDRTATGQGAAAGECIMQETGTLTFTVTSLNGTMMAFRSDYEYAFDFTANGIYASTKDICSSFKSESTTTFTVDSTNHKVTSIEPSPDVYGMVGRVAWFMVDPSGFSRGAVTGSWLDPSFHYIDVQWSVTEPRVLAVKGQSINAYGLTYSGQSSGYWKETSSNTWSSGPAMDTRLYDATYGIYVGSSATGKFTYATPNAGWTETFSRNRQIADTNIRFPASYASTTLAALTEYSTTTQIQQIVSQSGLADSVIVILSAGIAVLSAVVALVVYRSRSSKR
jgi:hypothetical protein